MDGYGKGETRSIRYRNGVIEEENVEKIKVKNERKFEMKETKMMAVIPT